MLVNRFYERLLYRLPHALRYVQLQRILLHHYNKITMAISIIQRTLKFRTCLQNYQKSTNFKLPLSPLFFAVCRMKWQLIRALQMFAEHVVLKHEGMIPYTRRLHLVRFRWLILSCVACRTMCHCASCLLLWKTLFTVQHLKRDADFLKASTVDRVKKHLNSMDHQLKSKLK